MILLTHAVMDAIRAYCLSDSLAPFLADQFVRLAVLLGLACYFPDTANDGWWITSLKPDPARWYFASLSCISGIILCGPAGGILIAKLIRRFTDEIHDNDIAGLTEGGSVHRLAGANIGHAVPADGPV